jgi:HD-like signal output (HDOD) protein
MTAALWRGLRRRTSPFMKDWWRHSIAAALIARQSSKDLDVDFAYTAALLHSSGQLALIEDSPQDYPKLVECAYVDGRDLLACERDVFGIDHALLTGLILRSWGLPEKLSDAAARHHDAITSVPLVLAVQIGCCAAEHAGFGRCGCHQLLSACGPPEELLVGNYSLKALVAEINQIECFLT